MIGRPSYFIFVSDFAHFYLVQNLKRIPLQNLLGLLVVVSFLIVVVCLLVYLVLALRMKNLSPKIAFALVSFFLGELGDGLNIFQVRICDAYDVHKIVSLMYCLISLIHKGIYLVALGWNEGSVGIALSMMGFTALIVQTFAGDIIDKTIFDRRKFLSLAAVATAFSASAILFVREGNEDHMMIFITKIIEGVSSSFIGPCMAALTLATSGPELFDEVMASNIFWGHVGSIASAVLAGLAGYLLYPNIKYCFLVIGFSALMAVGGVQFLPEGDPLLGRGLQTNHNTSGGTLDDALAPPSSSNNDELKDNMKNETNYINMDQQQQSPGNKEEVASYWSILADRKTLVLCLTGFFFHFANANVLLVLGELMGGDEEDGGVKRSAIPLIAGAIVLAQFTMSGATIMGDKLTKQGWGRKPLFLAGLITLPIRCALIIFWKDAGESFLLSTQILDGKLSHCYLFLFL